jgi:hypothetical protein
MHEDEVVMIPTTAITAATTMLRFKKIFLNLTTTP